MLNSMVDSKSRNQDKGVPGRRVMAIEIERNGDRIEIEIDRRLRCVGIYVNGERVLFDTGGNPKRTSPSEGEFVDREDGLLHRLKSRIAPVPRRLGFVYSIHVEMDGVVVAHTRAYSLRPLFILVEIPLAIFTYNFPFSLITSARWSLRSGQTMLQSAAMHGFWLSAKFLLLLGADPNRCDDPNSAPLALAAFNKSGKTVRVLLRHGARPDGPEDVLAYRKQLVTPLFIATCREDEKSAILLLRAGATPDIYDSCGQTPLAVAADCGCAGIARALLDASAEIDQRDAMGKTPLYWAVVGRHKEVVRLLLDRGADCNSADSTGVTILMAACRLGDPSSIFGLLGRLYEIEELKTRLYRTCPSQSLATMRLPGEGPEEDGLEIVAMLLEAGANVNATTKTGITALHSAADLDDDALCKLLLTHGASVDAVEDKGMSALSFAVGREGKCVETLLKHGADQRRCVRDGHTALHSAASSGYTTLIASLLDYGADINARNDKGLTPLDLALDLEKTDFDLDSGAKLDPQLREAAKKNREDLRRRKAMTVPFIRERGGISSADL